MKRGRMELLPALGRVEFEICPVVSEYHPVVIAYCWAPP